MSRTFKAIPEAVDVPSGQLAAALGLPSREPGAPRLVIGRREWLALPDFGIRSLDAKTDSGARGSSLHVENLELSHDKTSARFTTFCHHGNAVECTSPVARFGQVRSSSGVIQERVFIHANAVFCGGFRWSILLSLANRSDMLYPLLLGRRALAGYFLIDPLRVHLLGTRRQLEQEIPASTRCGGP